jgi:hypothetical protein
MDRSVVLLEMEPSVSMGVSGRGLTIMGLATSRSSPAGRSTSVTIMGQRKQAAPPSWRHHQHFGRRRQGGSFSTTVGSDRVTGFANRHSAPSKCRQALPAHGAANLKTFVGFTGSERASSSSVTGCGLLRYAKRGSSAGPLTTPNATASCISG